MTTRSDDRTTKTRRSLMGALQLLLLLVVGLMWIASASYLELGRRHPFVLDKLPLTHPEWFLGALWVHVPSSLVALPACIGLTTIARRPALHGLHRWLGRLTGILVLFAVVPSGLVLSLYARGGLPSTVGFGLTGIIAFAAMVASVRAARRRRFREHRRYSLHVSAQLAVAVISRVMLAIAELNGAHGDGVYIAALWLPVLGGLVFAEVWSGSGSLPSRKKETHEEAVDPAGRLDLAR